MSRHRNVRSLDYNDEYDGYDDIYGHSVEEDSCISPSDAAQFMYDRSRNPHAISNFIDTHNDIKEESDEEIDDHRPPFQRRDSLDFRNLNLTDEDEIKLMSCLDELRNILGDTVSDSVLVAKVIENQFDMTKSLDAILNVKKPNEGQSSRETSQTYATAEKVPKLVETKSINTVIEPIRIITPTDFKPVLKGFKVDDAFSSQPGTPRAQSPASGRGTPFKSNDQSYTEEFRTTFKVKENKIDPTVQYKNERSQEKEQLYIVVIGHVDAGKSTLMGRLLCELGEVNQRTLHKYEQESKKLGKQSFMYAWVLDETGEERLRGITMDVGRAQFSTKTKKVIVLDAPGHADFIPNMIAGAGQADVALLVVDATRGEFETGFEQGGQTREHALLVRSLGVSQLAVAINKLDTSNWSQERFDEISAKLKFFLKQAGFRDNDITFVPCSGLTGENLAKRPKENDLLKWYNGPSLLDVIDNFKVPERPVTKPFRMSINDIFKGTGPGFCVSGRIETGLVNKGDKILVCPTKEPAEVKAIWINEMTQTVAFAGDQVSITLSGVDIQNVSVGFVLSDATNPIQVASRFEARIVVFNVKVPITKGFPIIIHHQSLIESANIVNLKALLNKSTGEVLKKKPRCLGNNSVALIEIEVCRPISLETYKDVKELGRIMLRVAGVTIAAGLITDIVK